MAEGISLTREDRGSGEAILVIPSLPENLLAFYYDNAEYQKAASEGIVPNPRQIVFEMLSMMLDVEDERLLEKLVSDIVCHNVELEREWKGASDPNERILSMIEATRESSAVSSQMAKRLALGVLQSNTESSYFPVALASELASRYVICTSNPCTPIRVMLWIIKGKKTASDYLDPSSSDFNPSLISRIKALRSLIRNGIKCVLLYEIENDISDTDKSIVCETLRAKLGDDLSFYANLPKGFYESEENLNLSGALCYSIGPFSYSSVEYAFSINATQHKQQPHLDKFVVNAGKPRYDPKIGRKFEEEFQFVSEFLPLELTKEVDPRRPSTSKE